MFATIHISTSANARLIAWLVTRAHALVGRREQRDEADADDRERHAEQEAVDAPRQHLPQPREECQRHQSLSSFAFRASRRRAAPAPALAPCAGEVVVEHLPRDRRRGLRAEAAVLDQHRERDPRLVGRRVGDEPRVVAQALVDLLAVYFSPFSEYTCAVPVLPPLDVRRLDERGGARAFLVDADQRVLDEGEVLRLERHRVRRLARDLAHLAGAQFCGSIFTRCGRNATPSLATVAIACASWIGVNAL